MKREKTRQKNVRLPESLLADLKEVTDKLPTTTETDIIIAGTRAKIRGIKRRIEKAEVAIA